MNDLTNRELIRKNFKFEQFTIIDKDDLKQQREAEITSIEEDMIIEGSTIFNNGGLYEYDIPKVGNSRMTNDLKTKGRTVGSKDITSEAN